MRTTSRPEGSFEHQAVFPATSGGIEAARTAGERLPLLWSGLAAESGRVAVAARALMWWLAANESPGTPIALAARYMPLRGELRLRAQDAGRSLPVALAGDALRVALGQAGDAGSGAAYVSEGRMVYCRLRLNPVVLRARWRVAAGADHPALTYRSYSEADSAEQAAAGLWDLEPGPGVALTGVDLGAPAATGAMHWSGRARMIGAAA
jgi:hypothetical protein